MNTVLVTGANGFVGRPLCEALSEQGNSVRAAVRNPSAASTLPETVAAAVVEGSVETADWLPHLEGVEAVVHLIGRTHVMRDRSPDPESEYRRINVDGTRRLLEACRASGVRRFVFMSSIKAVGEGAVDPYDERSPCRPRNPYGRSKREAEQLVLQFAAAYQLEAVVIRTPLVYGPRARGNLLRLMRAVRAGIPLPLGRATAHRSLVSVRNLADAILAALAHPAAAGDIFHVADESSLSTRALVEKLAQLQRRRARVFPVPPACLRLAGRLANRRDDIERLFDPLVVCSEKIRSRLAWRPPFSLDRGLQEMVEEFVLSQENEPAARSRPSREACIAT